MNVDTNVPQGVDPFCRCHTKQNSFAQKKCGGCGRYWMYKLDKFDKMADCTIHSKYVENRTIKLFCDKCDIDRD